MSERMPSAMRALLLLLALAAAVPARAQEAAPTVPAFTTIVLVRHAEKIDDSEDPQLSEAGTQRAEALARALEHAGVRTILTTRYQRTRDTAAPLAARLGVAVEVVETGSGAAAHAGAFAARVRSLPPGHVAVIVGHSNSVPAIIAALGGPDVGPIEDHEYANFFVLQLAGDGTRLIRSRY
jgi:broad specificity phosphatase PhoE